MAIHTFQCSCCKLPFARIQNGVLIIESRHHGEKHTNVISLADLIQLIYGVDASDKQNSRAAANEAGMPPYSLM